MMRMLCIICMICVIGVKNKKLQQDKNGAYDLNVAEASGQVYSIRNNGSKRPPPDRLFKLDYYVTKKVSIPNDTFSDSP